MTALGMGAATGVITLLAFQRLLPRQTVFVVAVVVTGASIIAVASMSSLFPGFVLVGLLGAGAGCGYVSGFTLLQESVADDMRGRTFGTLYTIVRLCLLISLTIWPFIAGALNAIFEHAVDGRVDDRALHHAGHDAQPPNWRLSASKPPWNTPVPMLAMSSASRSGVQSNSAVHSRKVRWPSVTGVSLSVAT